MAPSAIEHPRPAAWFRMLVLACSLLGLIASVSCARSTPQQSYDEAYQLFVHGDLPECETNTANAYGRYRNSNPGWAAKFSNLQAECMIWAGLYEDALALYPSRSLSFDDPDGRIFALSLQAAAQTHLRKDLNKSHERLQQAETLCLGTTFLSCANVKTAEGMLSIEEGLLDIAQKPLLEGLALARSHGDRFTEATAQLDLGLVALRQRRFDECVDLNAEAIRLSEALGARDITQLAQGNQAWAYYRLGNFPRALKLFTDQEERAASLGDFTAQASWLEGIGKIEFETSEFKSAAEVFRQVLKLEEEKVHDVEVIYTALVPLAQLALQNGDLPGAEQHIQKALDIAHAAKIRADELYPIMIQGQIAVRRGDFAEAARKFREVEQDDQSQVSVKWEAQRSLAGLAEQQNNLALADREYRAALTTFELARATVQNEDSRLAFLTNASRIYDDYLHFLISHGRSDEALRWADYSRARTLAEGLSVLPKEAAPGPPPLLAQEIARKVEGTLLFYWLGERQSYLWAITAHRTALFTLPSGAQIEAAVRRYRNAIDDKFDVLDSADENGRLLYQMLITPVQSMLGKNAKVFILPDGQLNDLNFETLLAPSPKLHYWIEDVTVANASSLRMLAAWAQSPPANARPNRSLLLVGNPVPPNDQYPALPKATIQMDAVKAHFIGVEHKALTGAEATTPAYIEGHPESYAYIHFVTHGIASRLSPLDSAIVLSKSSADNDSFKLYARDIIHRPLHAELVTVAACYGAKGNSYLGEGLVGLSWAFLRAGAHNVVAALWEVTDAPSPQQMDQFYDGIEHGQNLNAALRASKLTLLHGDKYRNPHYWATFQLYVGAGPRRNSASN